MRRLPTNKVAILCAVIAAAHPFDAEAKAHRSAAARSEFQRERPCPATGKPHGPCHGYVIDHVVPLCAGGQDAPGNMQWQTIADAKAKDREERRMCRRRTL
jgi:hypothetical protein